MSGEEAYNAAVRVQALQGAFFKEVAQSKQVATSDNQGRRTDNVENVCPPKA
jgi:hypothetical protein